MFEYTYCASSLVPELWNVFIFTRHRFGDFTLICILWQLILAEIENASEFFVSLKPWILGRNFLSISAPNLKLILAPVVETTQKIFYIIFRSIYMGKKCKLKD